MTSKDLLVRLGWLLVCVTCVAALHFALISRVDSIAQRYAPVYSPLSDEEAAKSAMSSCEGSVSARISGVDCEKAFSGYIHRVQSEHYDSFYRREIEPISKRIELVAVFVFGLIYFVTAIYALRFFFQWFNPRAQQKIFAGMDNARSKIDRGIASVSKTSLDLPGLKRSNAGRKLRKAEDEFRVLKNLHENGLITDDMFQKGKDELKAVLDNNEIFRSPS